MTGTVTLSRLQFRATALRIGRPPLVLDEHIESVTWSDITPILAGTLAAREPGLSPSTIGIAKGDQVHLEAGLWGTNTWTDVFTLRVFEPGFTGSTGSATFNLISDLNLLATNRGDFHYKRSKKSGHPRGWLTSEVIEDLCRRYAVTLARPLPEMTHRIVNLTLMNTAPIDVLSAVLNRERVHSGRRFVVEYRRGVLVIRKPTPTVEMLKLRDQIIEAVVQETENENFATVVTVRATAGDSKKKDKKGRRRVKHRKISVVVSSAPGIARYGSVHKFVTAPDADTEAQAIEFGKRWLAKVMKPVREVTITIPGITTIRRGDATQLTIPEVGFDGVVAFVKEAQHNAGGGDYGMDLTVGFDSSGSQDAWQTVK